jgi:hypothetical protein
MAHALLGWIPGVGDLLDVVNFVVDATQLIVLKIGVDVVQCVVIKC